MDRIWCIKGIYRLKVVSSEKKFGFKGLTGQVSAICIGTSKKL